MPLMWLKQYVKRAHLNYFTVTITTLPKAKEYSIIHTMTQWYSK